MQKIEPIAKAEMLIRKPVKEVFEAFVNPEITSKFWFSKSSGRLEPGSQIRWDWEIYGVFTQVQVLALEPPKRILIDWSDPITSVEWTFSPQTASTTFVSIQNWGFCGTTEEITAKAMDSVGGFNLLLAGLKAFLEHDIQLNLVADHNPNSSEWN